MLGRAGPAALPDPPRSSRATTGSTGERVRIVGVTAGSPGDGLVAEGRLGETFAPGTAVREIMLRTFTENIPRDLAVNRSGFGGDWCALSFVEPGCWTSCHGGDGLELYRGQHAEAAVASLPVVEDLQVRKDRVGELDAGAPASLVEEFDLHP